MLAAGQKIRASEINDITPLFASVASDLTRTSNTTLIAVTGLSIALEANAVYAIDGYIGYDAAQAGDLKLAITVPTGATGHWGVQGVVTSSTTNGGTDGDLTGQRADTFGTGTTLAVNGSSNFSGAMVCLIRAFVDTSSTAGNVAVQYAQNTSNATPTRIKAGTWLRAWKIT